MNVRPSLLAVVCSTALPFVAGAQATKKVIADIPQTIEYERYLLEEPNGSELKRYAYKIDELTEEMVRDSADGPLMYYLPLNFVNSSREEVSLADYELLVEQLNEVFDFTAYDTELTRIEFCLSSALVDSKKLSLEERLGEKEGQHKDKKVKDKELFDAVKGHLKGAGKLLSEEAINVILVGGDEELLGFASTVPHKGGTDVIVAAAELLTGEIDTRNEGRTVAQLIASYIGLKPIWYDETGEGDFVEDTPCYNGPNYGNPKGTVHLSMCDGMPMELTDNIMDNTHETVRTKWTVGQINRLHQLLQTPAFRRSVVKGACLPVQPLFAEVDEGVAGPNPNGEVEIKLWPNPASESIVISFLLVADPSVEFSGSVSLQDGSGRSVEAPMARTSPWSYRLDVAGLAPGTYYVSVMSGNGRKHTKSFYRL